MEYQLYPLQDGFRFLHRQNWIKGITHCCILIQVGSRDEDPHLTGIAHFTEHMLFKGTARRNNRQILNHLELVGGEINAFTTKEYTCIHASFLDHYIDRALDLLSDMILHSNFPKQEIEREKGVIGDELDSYRDIPEEYIQDDFDEQVFGDHPLGKNILGTKETIQRMDSQILDNYKNQYFHASNLILGVYNGMSPNALKPLVDKYFGKLPTRSEPLARLGFTRGKAVQKTVTAPIHQVHGLLGGLSYSAHEQGRIPMLLLMNLLGGPGMSSRLNLEIREKRGICYQIESNYSPLSDTGIFSIYFATETGKHKKCMDLIFKELNSLRNKGLSSLYLHQSKARFKGQIALADENHSSVLISLCKSVQDYGYADSLPEIFSMIDKVTISDILEVANDHFHPDHLSSLLLVPELD